MSLKIFDRPANTPVQFIDTFKGNIELYLKREDLIHPQVSGNKWRKLKYNLKDAYTRGCRQIITFGGAFSNHIHATAAAGFACGFKTIGLIRGEVVEPLNPTLKQAVDWGMKLIPVTREQYRMKEDARYQAHLKSRFANGYLIPEGGTNQLALKGCAEITEGSEHFDFWCLSCGTGGTLAGLLTGLGPDTTVVGFPALKGGEFLETDIKSLLKSVNVQPSAKWKLETGYHFGGYAKISGELIDFIVDFNNRYHILLDPIYTGKMLFGIFELLKKGFFPDQSRVLAIHTGGLQGIAGIEKKYGIELN